MKALLIDIGNSRVKGRLIDTRARKALDLEPVPLDRLDQLSYLWRALVGAAVELIWISNVASGDVEASIVRWLRETAPTAIIAHVIPDKLTAGVTNGYRDPGRLGPDRWMALVGAHALLPDRSLLVCSFGTATTLDLLRDDGGVGATFVGGVIVPGIDAMRVALLERTARLDVRAGAIVDFADNTEDAISSGVMLAQIGALREAWSRARDRTEGRLECIVAGGAGGSIIGAFDRSDVVVHHVPDLVLRGLAVLAEQRLVIAASPRASRLDA